MSRALALAGAGLLAGLLAGCASQTALLLPGEAGHPVGALVVLNKDGSDRTTLNEANEAYRGGNGVQRNVKVKPAYNELIAGLPLPAQPFSIYYESGKDVPVRDATFAKFLDDIRTEIGNRPGAEVQVTGHTDSDGSPSSNIDLSKRRAEKFRDVLVNEDHFPADQVTLAWRGDLEPLDPKHPDDKDANRRIEVIVR